MNSNKYYNEFFELGQQKINFKFYELSLPDEDPVFTLKKVMEEMELELSHFKKTTQKTPQREIKI